MPDPPNYILWLSRLRINAENPILLMIWLFPCSFDRKCAQNIVSLVLALSDELTLASRVVIRINIVTAYDGLGDSRRINISGSHRLSINLGDKLWSSVLLVVNWGHRCVKNAANSFTFLKFCLFFFWLVAKVTANLLVWVCAHFSHDLVCWPSDWEINFICSILRIWLNIFNFYFRLELLFGIEIFVVNLFKIIVLILGGDRLEDIGFGYWGWFGRFEGCR